MDQKANLLLVEDDQGISEALAQLLKVEGYRVSIASNGKDALKRFAEDHVDLVLLDLNLGGHDGWEVFHELKRQRQDLPIIVVSAEAKGLTHRSAAQASAVLEKPFDVPHLLNLLIGAITPRALSPLKNIACGLVALFAMLMAPFSSQAQSDLRINSLQVRDGTVVVQWQGGGVTNQLQAKTSIDGEWQDIDIPTGATSGTSILLEPTAFYRVLNLQDMMAVAADKKAPSTPTGLTATPASCTQINLSWNASSDSGPQASGVQGYNIYRNGIFLKQVAAPATSTSDTGLSPSTGYNYSVLAIDRTRNASAKSPVVWVSTPSCLGNQNQAPFAYAGGDFSTTPGAAAAFSASGSYDVDGFLVSYYWEFGDGYSAYGDSVWHAYGWAGTFTARLTVTDNSGASSTDTVLVNVAAPGDTTPPSASLVSPSSGSTVSGTITLVASATDNFSGVSRVEFYRDGIGLGTLTAAPYNLEFNTTTLPNGTYTFYVYAYDNAGNAASSSAVMLSVNNGAPPSTGGQYLWARQMVGLSGSADVQSRSTAVDSAGNVVAGGFFADSMDFGAGVVRSVGGYDGFVVKYSANGSYQWARRLGGTDTDYVRGVALDSAGNVYALGQFQSANLDLGFGPVASAGAGDIYLLKLSSSGTPLWAKVFGGTGIERAYSVTVDSRDNVIISGGFGMYGTPVDFGAGPMSSAGQSDVFLAKYSPTGAAIWAKRFGGSGDDFGTSVAVDRRDDSVLITGQFQAVSDFGGGLLSSAGANDIFLCKYSSSGTHVWSKKFGDTSSDQAGAVSVDSSGNVAVVGNFMGTVNFGLGALVFGGSSDMFIANFTPTGVCRWVKNYGTAFGGDALFGVTSDPSGNVVVTGMISGFLDLGGGYLPAQNGQDILVAKFSPNGSHVWSKRFGGYGYDYGYGVASDSAGNVYGTGYFVSSVDFGGGQMTTAGWNNGYVVKLAP